MKGTSNEKLVRHVRMVNPTAKIIATAEVLAETQTLYAAGADYVTIARLDQANELVDAVTAAEAGLLDDMKARLEAQLRDRQEICRKITVALERGSIILQQPLDVIELELRAEALAEALAQLFEDAAGALHVDLARHLDGVSSP